MKKISNLSIFSFIPATASILTFLILSKAVQALPLSQVPEAAVQSVVVRMTLDEKIGQMTQVDSSSLKNIDDIETYHLGSILSGGDSDPKTGNGPQDWANLYNTVQARALKTRLAIPLLYGIDAVHGHNNVLGAVIFPHNVGMGATRDPNLIMRAAQVTAEEVRATGINWAFSPMVGVTRDKRWGRAYESFGETSELSQVAGIYAVLGLQGQDLAAPNSVLATAKHFIGDGGTKYGTGILNRIDRGDTQISEATLRALHLPGYIQAIRAGVGTIMPSYSSWNGKKMSGIKYLLTDVLKVELGFRGFLISDWGALNELPGDYTQQVEQSINAGMDMVMVPDKYPQFFSALKSLVQSGRVPEARINDAVSRILRVKIAMGLLDRRQSVLANPLRLRNIGSPEHRMVARQAVRESMVLLKNDNQLLPLPKTIRRIHMAGSSANDIGNQCGGWTVGWQGKSGQAVPGATSILQGVTKAVAGRGTQVTFSVDGRGAQGADVGVVVVGETPYAEMFGDKSDLRLNSNDAQAVQTIQKLGIPVVLIIVSGRPLILDQALTQSQAVMAAWLPGSEGDGVADVIFGDYKPTGKLPVSWPKSMDQISTNVGDPGYAPLFPYGFGLSYSLH